jgi:hypothetical protein
MKKGAENIHTPTMNLKNAAFRARVGTVMLTVLLIAGFIFHVLSVLRGLIPATRPLWELGDGNAALSGLAPHLLVRGTMRHREARLFAPAAAVHSGA